MENKNFTINQTCLQHLVDINNALPSVETKGDSTMIMYKIRLTLGAVLKQMQEDNKMDEAENNGDLPIKENKED